MLPLRATLLVACCAVPVRAADVHVSPPAVTLTGNFARAQLLVTAGTGDRADDLTGSATYQTSDPKVVTVSPAGRLLAAGNGNATVTVSANGITKAIPVTVTGVSDRPAIGFVEHVMPVLSKAGCNAGACHASQFGKGGFKLSVFGFSPNDDYAAIVRDGFGRRANVEDPARSLFLLKPTEAVPHEGGKRLQAGSVDHQLLIQWLKNGAPRPNPAAPAVTALKIEPTRRVGPAGFTQQLQVLATYADGRTVDVTPWAKYDSLDDAVLRVDADGRVRTVGKGQGAALVRFEGQAAISTIVVP